MKSTKKVLCIITSAILITSSLLGATSMAANAATATKSVSAKNISSKNWMKYLKDDIKLNELNIPGAHDAAMIHSTAVFPASTFTLTQKYHIGKQTWTDKGFFRSDKKVSEDGLLERGVRYLDIRYGFTGGERKHSGIQYASDRLKLVHGGFTAKCKVTDDSLGIAHYDNVNNEKLMQWLKSFLNENPSETVVLDISSDDGKENNPVTESFVYDFYKQQAENPNPKYPEIYVGNHVPTLGEARGKLVILTDINAKNYWDDMNKNNKSSNDFSVYKNGSNIGDWAFKNAYTVGDKSKKSFGLAAKDDNKKYAIFKDNYWEDDSMWTSDKWQWVRNGLEDAESIMSKEKHNNCNAFMLNFASSNSVSSLTGPQFYAERLIPRITNHIMNDTKGKFYGIIAMDFCDTDNAGKLDKTSFGSDTSSRIIFETNFSRYGITNS